jgi:hypothetical protein
MLRGPQRGLGSCCRDDIKIGQRDTGGKLTGETCRIGGATAPDT